MTFIADDFFDLVEFEESIYLAYESSVDGFRMATEYECMPSYNGFSQVKGVKNTIVPFKLNLSIYGKV
jgi:hypothetical protein